MCMDLESVMQTEPEGKRGTQIKKDYGCLLLSFRSGMMLTFVSMRQVRLLHRAKEIAQLLFVFGAISGSEPGRGTDTPAMYIYVITRDQLISSDSCDLN
jgi:hypothetical protein